MSICWGVDFEMSETKRYHFAEGRTAGAIKGNMSTFAKLQAWFTELQPLFLKAGYVVTNCNEQSRLTAFPFLPYEEALAESGARLGDPTNERTEGMYQKPDEKLGKAPAAGEKAEIAASEPGDSATKSARVLTSPATEGIAPDAGSHATA